MLSVLRNGFEQPMQSRHEIRQDRCHGGIEEICCEVIDTQLQRSQALRDLFRTCAEGKDEIGCHARLDHELATVRWRRPTNLRKPEPPGQTLDALVRLLDDCR